MGEKSGLIGKGICRLACFMVPKYHPWQGLSGHMTHLTLTSFSRSRQAIYKQLIFQWGTVRLYGVACVICGHICDWHLVSIHLYHCKIYFLFPQNQQMGFPIKNMYKKKSYFTQKKSYQVKKGFFVSKAQGTSFVHVRHIDISLMGNLSLKGHQQKSSIGKEWQQHFLVR